MAEVLANDMASGDVDDWEQYMLKGMEMVDSNDQLGILPSEDDVSYLLKHKKLALLAVYVQGQEKVMSK